MSAGLRMRNVFATVGLLIAAHAAVAADPRPPEGLPQYELAIHLDTAGQQARVNQHVVWTNRSDKPVTELVFNVHSRFTPPDTREKILQFAKLLEIFRLPFRDAIYVANAFNLEKVERVRRVGNEWKREELKHQWNKDLSTALIVPLPEQTLDYWHGEAEQMPLPGSAAARERESAEQAKRQQ